MFPLLDEVLVLNNKLHSKDTLVYGVTPCSKTIGHILRMRTILGKSRFMFLHLSCRYFCQCFFFFFIIHIFFNDNLAVASFEILQQFLINIRYPKQCLLFQSRCYKMFHVINFLCKMIYVRFAKFWTIYLVKM